MRSRPRQPLLIYYHKTIIKSMLAPKRPSSTLNHPKLKPTVLELDVVADIFCMLFFWYTDTQQQLTEHNGEPFSTNRSNPLHKSLASLADVMACQCKWRGSDVYTNIFKAGLFKEWSHLIFEKMVGDHCFPIMSSGGLVYYQTLNNG
jgi:hypothetical protein